MKWSGADIRLLQFCANSGMSARRAAGLLGRTPAAILQKASHLHIRFHGGRGGAPKGNDNRRIGMRRKTLV